MSWINSVLSSTFLLTILLAIGLLSFLKSSVKDRTTEMIFRSQNLDDDRLLVQVRNHFKQRAYQVAKLDPNQESVTLSGQVKPSVFLAILFTSLAAIGFASLGLVVGTLLPDLEQIWWVLILTSPIAGIFYWRGADRKEEVSLELRPQSQLWVRGHKDELMQLQRSLDLEIIARQ